MLKVTPIVPGMALKGEKPRERVLSDLELRRLWQAADTRAYPFGPYVKLLMLTGQRPGEIASLRWAEIDAAEGLIEFAGAR